MEGFITFFVFVIICQSIFTLPSTTNSYDDFRTPEYGLTGTNLGPTAKIFTFPSYFYLSTTNKYSDITLLNRYVFESVDYEQIPQNLKDDYHDCYGQHIRCVRHRTDHAPVCGYNLWSGYFSDFYGPCQIDLTNCIQRMKYNLGVYGVNYKDDVIFYNGEGYNCIYYLRMARSKEEMNELYFGDELYRIKGEKNI